MKLIKLSVLLGKILFPIAAVILKLFNPQVRFGWLVVGGLLLVMVERGIETLYCNQVKEDMDKLEKDWLFQTVTALYIALVFIILFEFFKISRIPQLSLSLISGAIFLVALFLRLWGIKTLGKGWQINDTPRQLYTREGPYKYMRHPIYFGFILEVLTLPLFFATYYAFLFSAVIFVPLILLKAYLEEKKLLDAYPLEYDDYITKTWAFGMFPKR